MGHSHATLKKAQAGLAMMEGGTQKAALMGAGYSESTAQCPTGNGINAERCYEAVAEVYPEVAPVELLHSARLLFKKKLAMLHASDKKLDQCKVGEVAKCLDIVEKHHSERQPARGSARDAGERLAYLAEVLESYRLAGGDVAALSKGLRQDKGNPGE